MRQSSLPEIECVTEEGKKSQTFVYAGSDLLARQNLSAGTEPVETVHWEHWDPAKISRRTTDKDRLSPGFSGVELDPLNKNALYFCLPQQPERGQYLLNPRDYPGAQAASAMQFCNYEGLYGPCDIVEGLGGDFMPFFGRNDRFAQLPFEIGPRPIRNFDHPLAVAWDTFHELYPAVFINQSDYNYAEGASNHFVSSIYGYGMSDLHRLIGGSLLPGAVRLSGDQATVAEIAASDLGNVLRNGEISSDCKRNVIDKLSTLGFDIDSFLEYLSSGIDFFDANKSSTPLSLALDSRQFKPPPGINTIADLFFDPRSSSIDLLTSGNSSSQKLTIWVRTDRPVFESYGTPDGRNSYNMALIFHEALHGYGSQNAVGSKSAFGSYSDPALLKLFFPESTPTNSAAITEYIADHCNNFAPAISQ